ncbi:MAG: PD-(D/E)XK nuclease family protein [Candidatus Aminicenantes bacterium]|nr:PD-(D/E)XK nuclease family protein [Candidatus Aminicenantes bacterium]
MLELIGLQEDLVAHTGRAVLEQRAGNDLSAVSVVFPSRRFGFFLRQELSRAVAGNYFPPAMFPVEAFIEALFRLNFPGFRVLDDLEAAHALYQSAKAVFASGMYGSKSIGDFSSFLPWAQKVLEALEEIQSEGGETESLNWESYEEFTKLGEYHRPYKEFIQSLPALLHHLRQSLRQKRRASKGMMWRDVADLAEKGELRIPQAQAWILSGFNATNACERKLFRFLIHECRARFILRTDPKALGNPRSPIHLQAETISALGLEMPPAAPVSRPWNDLAGRVTIHPCDGVESEAFHAFRELESICRGRSVEQLKKVAVLLPSPPTLIPFVQGAVSRFDQDQSPVPFNITLGYPFERTPMMQLVEALLAVVENLADGMIAAGDYLRLVRHPYVKISGERSGLEPLKRGIHILEDIINGRNLVRFTIRDLAQALAAEIAERRERAEAELAAGIQAQVDGMHQRFIPPAIDSFTGLLGFLRRAIESVGSQGNRSAHLFLNEYAAAALAALEELEIFAVSRSEAFHGAGIAGMAALVRAHFRRRTIRFEGSPLKGVQVMGPLEFRGLAFDEIVVLDALEGVLPGTAKYDPILPADIRTLFRIRDHGDWEKIYAFNFFAMLGAAGRVHIFYPRDGDEGRDRERSRFIERIAYEVEKQAGHTIETADTVLRFALPESVTKKAEKTKAVLDTLDSLALSPSSLETYISCPLQFYFNQVLGLQEREEFAGESEGGLIGTIAHRALGAFYDKYKSAAAMAAVGLDALEIELDRFVDAAFSEFHLDPQHGLERIRAWTLKEQLRLFIREDRRRLKGNGIQIKALETSLAMELAVPGLKQPVRLRGRLDRWESEGDSLRVIDYKTGAPFPPRIRMNDSLDLSGLYQREDKESLEALAAFRQKYPGMQLQIYLMLLGREKDKAWEKLDAAYVFLRDKGTTMVQGIFASGGRNPRPFTQEEKRLAMEAFHADLQEVLRDLYLRSHFVANRGDERHCSYCPFRLPCGNL